MSTVITTPTGNIGVRAAEVLRKRDRTGTRIVELLGAADTGYDEVTDILSEALGRKIEHVTVTDEQLIQALTGMGVSKVLAASLAELVAGIVQGGSRTVSRATRPTPPPRPTAISPARSSSRPSTRPSRRGAAPGRTGRERREEDPDHPSQHGQAGSIGVVIGL